MKTYLTLIMSLAMLPISEVLSQEVGINKSKEEILKELGISNIDEILENIGEERTKLDDSAIRSLLKKHRDKFFGEVSDVRKYNNLRELCEIIRKRPDKVKMTDLEVKQIELTKAWTKEPVGWDELTIDSKGGSVGLLIDCLIDVGKDKQVVQVFDAIAENKDHLKMHIFLDKIRIKGDIYDFLSTVEKKRMTTNDVKLNIVLDKYIVEAKKRKIHKEKAREDN